MKAKPDSAARAAVEAGGEWPRAGLAMMTGKLSPDEMLKSLEKKQGDEQQMALAEAYFYLGQYYLMAGDRTKAQESFEKTRSLGIINYQEHTAAEFELDLLKKPSAATPPEPSLTTAAKQNAAPPSKPTAAPPPSPRAVAQ